MYNVQATVTSFPCTLFYGQKPIKDLIPIFIIAT